eukprot:TRINITY_DN20514_c0_g1_i1.p1 TRINITY_DN20514_c0_g1~~TRINITY_DN20514_c0_g1_i1.p1  ORF type:complete len:112 (+),score=2.10 TRINITY_DN20514_c0_g1_i1:34-369(+)
MTKILLVFILLIISAFIEGKKHTTRSESYISQRRYACERGQCNHLPVDVRDNCVNQCINVDCFIETYENQFLEDGELDSARYQQFTGCIKKKFEACTLPDQTCPNTTKRSS